MTNIVDGRKRFELNKDLYEYWKSLGNERIDFILGDWTRQMPEGTSSRENWKAVAELFVKLCLNRDPVILRILEDLKVEHSVTETKLFKSLALGHIEAPENNFIYILLNNHFSRSSFDLNVPQEKKLYSLIVELAMMQYVHNGFSLDRSFIETPVTSWDKGFISDCWIKLQVNKEFVGFFSLILGEVIEFISPENLKCEFTKLQDNFTVQANVAQFLVVRFFKNHQNILKYFPEDVLQQPIKFNGNVGNLMDMLLLAEDDELVDGGHLFENCDKKKSLKYFDVFSQVRTILQDVERTKFGVKTLVGVLSLHLTEDVDEYKLNDYICFFERDMFEKEVYNCVREIHPAIRKWLDNH